MKHAAISVAVEAVGSVRQKAKMQIMAGIGNNGSGKAWAIFQFWRWVIILMVVGCVLAAGMWVALAGFGDLMRVEQNFFLLQGSSQVAEYPKADVDVCHGRRIYMYEMPSQFNDGIIESMCEEQHRWLNMCGSFDNKGFGAKMEKAMDPLEVSWYDTEQFALEVILHERMKNYECLTNNEDLADLFFLPYYVGLDVSMYIFTEEVQMRDLLTERFFGWLMAQPSWIRLQGHRHVITLSRIIWDFTRQVNSMSWGNSILSSYEMQNTTKLLIERNPRDENLHTMAIPYPTSFHPTSDNELETWLEEVTNAKREVLVSFVGAPRNLTRYPNMKIRDVLFNQCANSSICGILHCWHVDCVKRPDIVVRHFMNSTFCLQPYGDSPTRKAVFDCLSAGSIPVFFSPDTAYSQYLWHLPKDGSSYSVLLEDAEVSDNGFDVMAHLAKIPQEKIKSMQKVIFEQIIPSIIYDAPGGNPYKKRKDAFDLTLEHLFSSEFDSYPSLPA